MSGDRRPLRIATSSYYLPSESKIGAGYVAHRFAQQLVARGHQVTMFSPCRRPDDAAYDHVHVPIEGHLRTFRWPFHIRRLDLRGYDVFHAHGDDHLRIGRPTPVHVRTMHGSCLSEALHIEGGREKLRMALLGLTEVAATGVADATVLISESTRRWFPWVHTVIGNGVDVERFHPGAKASEPTILFVGTYERRKRGRLLADVFEREIRPVLPEARLELVCSDAPARPGVAVLGRLTDDELAERYRAAWAFCLPSTYEGFGVPYIEAMASGTPVVATPNPGAVEVLAGGLFGDVVADDELGASLLGLLQDPERRARRAADGLSRAADYSWDRICEQYEALYAELLDRRSPRRGPAAAGSSSPAGPVAGADPDPGSDAGPDAGDRAAGWLPVLANVTTPFSEYAAASGNARATRLYQYSRALEARGGTSYVVASDRRTHDYDAGDLILVGSRRPRAIEYLTETERRVDGAVSLVTGRRPFTEWLHEPYLRAVPPDADVVVVYNHAGVITRRFREAFDGLIVLELGNWVFRSWRADEVRRLLDRVDLVVCVSEHLADRVADLVGGRPRQLRVVRNGVDLEAFHPAPDGADCAGDVLFVGNMAPHKGAHHLVAAARVLHERGVDVHVRIVGSAGLRSQPALTPYERDLRALAEGLDEVVEFVPFVDRRHLPDVYRGASIFCMPVEWDEPAGQVVTEAMASGLAVVASHRGGIPEYLGEDGVYVDPTDHQALADRLGELLADPEGTRARGRSLRAAAEAMGWDRRLDELLEHLRDVRR